MKKLYVFGDSFMTQDPGYPGQHWSEIQSEYQTVIKSQSGSSNSMIAYQVFRCLTEPPDAVVVGFTAPYRLNFDMPAKGIINHSGRLWYNNGAVNYITEDQKLACEYYAATVSEKMVLLETYIIMRAIFLTLEKLHVPYAWTPLLLDSNIAYPLSATEDWKLILTDFEDKMVSLNLATYPDFKDSPGFHTHNHDWQQTFARQAIEIVQQQVAFYNK
jgi:hypothetical protein